MAPAPAQPEKQSKPQQKLPQPTPLLEDEIIPSRPVFGDALQKAKNKPEALTPASVLQLQRVIGNQATQQLVQHEAKTEPDEVFFRQMPIDISGGEAEHIQKKQGSKDALAEKEYVTVGNGEQIQWTDLVGGCIAFAFKYKGGGGMGYHLVMNSDEEGQWSELMSNVQKGSIESIHMFSDQLNSSQGWRVPVEYEDFMAGDAKSSGQIRSTTALSEAGITPNQYGDYIEGEDTYWSHTWVYIKQWMTNIFGVAPTYEEKMKGVTYSF